MIAIVNQYVSTVKAKIQKNNISNKNCAKLEILKDEKLVAI